MVVDCSWNKRVKEGIRGSGATGRKTVVSRHVERKHVMYDILVCQTQENTDCRNRVKIQKP